ncbi:MAG: hypothetical protein F4Y03_10120 [Alphaproteobacteria bacterium]|nr:hypothetical protein [Alphaproteobacteria bacterium]
MNLPRSLSILAAAASLALAGPALAGSAPASNTLELSAAAQSGACRDTFTGEADTTQSVSLAYRHESEDFSAVGYGRVSPAGGNCADTSFSFDAEIERRFDIADGWYGLARLGAERTTTTGSYRHVDGALVLFATLADGSPAYTSLLGAGKCFAGFCYELGANLAPNDYVGRSGAQSVHFRLSHSRDLLGGELEVEIDAEAPFADLGTLVTSQRVGWSREISDRFDVTMGVRRQAGLDQYASPFDPTVQLDGRPYQLGTTDPTVTTFEIGFRADL